MVILYFYRKMKFFKKCKRGVFDTLALKFNIPQTLMLLDENDVVEDEDSAYIEYREELLDYDNYS